MNQESTISMATATPNVERVDVRTNTVVASQRFHTCFSSFAGPGEVWSYREDEDGIGRIDVFRLRSN